MFDNQELKTTLNCTGPSCSRGLMLRLNTTNPEDLTVELLREFHSPEGLQSVIFGSMHPLPYPHGRSKSDPEQYIISWGVHAEFTDHTSDGQLLRDVQYSPLYPNHSIGGRGVESMRIYKQPWVGRPSWPPNVVVNTNGTLWVSWNGATELQYWAIYAGKSEADLGDSRGAPTPDRPRVEDMRHLSPVLTFPRAGFETEIELHGELPAFVKVAAIDISGDVIGYTETIRLAEDGDLWYGYSLWFVTLSSLLI
jgi:hypothetical protein